MIFTIFAVTSTSIIFFVFLYYRRACCRWFSSIDSHPKASNEIDSGAAESNLQDEVIDESIVQLVAISSNDSIFDSTIYHVDSRWTVEETPSRTSVLQSLGDQKNEDGSLDVDDKLTKDVKSGDDNVNGEPTNKAEKADVEINEHKMSNETETNNESATSLNCRDDDFEEFTSQTRFQMDDSIKEWTKDWDDDQEQQDFSEKLKEMLGKLKEEKDLNQAP